MKESFKTLKMEFLPCRSPDLQICDYWHHPWIKKQIHDENKIWSLRGRGRSTAEKDILNYYKSSGGTLRAAAEGMHKRVRLIAKYPSLSAEDSRTFKSGRGSVK